MSAARLTPSVLAVRGATKRFGAVVGLDGVDVEVRARRGARAARRQRRRQVDAHQVPERRAPLDSGEIQMDGAASRSTRRLTRARWGSRPSTRISRCLTTSRPTDNFYAGRELAGPSWLPRSLRVLQRRAMAETTRERSSACRSTLDDRRRRRPPVGRPAAGSRGRRAAAFASQGRHSRRADGGARRARVARVLDLILRLRERAQSRDRRLARDGSRDGGRRPCRRHAARAQGRRARSRAPRPTRRSSR